MEEKITTTAQPVGIRQRRRWGWILLPLSLRSALGPWRMLAISWRLLSPPPPLLSAPLLAWPGLSLSPSLPPSVCLYVSPSRPGRPRLALLAGKRKAGWMKAKANVRVTPLVFLVHATKMCPARGRRAFRQTHATSTDGDDTFNYPLPGPVPPRVSLPVLPFFPSSNSRALPFNLSTFQPFNRSCIESSPPLPSPSLPFPSPSADARTALQR